MELITADGGFDFSFRLQYARKKHVTFNIHRNIVCYCASKKRRKLYFKDI